MRTVTYLAFWFVSIIIGIFLFSRPVGAGYVGCSAWFTVGCADCVDGQQACTAQCTECNAIETGECGGGCPCQWGFMQSCGAPPPPPEPSPSPAASPLPSPPPPPLPSPNPNACKNALFTDQLTKVVINPNGITVSTPTDFANALPAGTFITITNVPQASPSPTPAPVFDPSCPLMSCSYSELSSTCPSGIQVVTGTSPSGCSDPSPNACSDCTYVSGCSESGTSCFSGPYIEPIQRLQANVDFSKLGAIFAQPSSNYLESNFQDEDHRFTDILGLSSPEFNAYHGPGQKAAPMVMTDTLKLNYVVYIHDKPKLAESANLYSDIYGNDPQTIAELWSMWGKPKPPSLGTPSVATDPKPTGDCRLTHSPGDELYQCNLGDSSSCDPTNACAGVPWICNEDGNWSIRNKDGECTTQCQDCRASDWDTTWGRYWEKIPTAVNEFYYGILTLDTAAGTKAIEEIQNGICADKRLRKIYFVMPEYFRTASIANQLNQTIVPQAAQSSTADFAKSNLKLAKENTQYLLAKVLKTIFKPLSNIPFSDFLPQKFRKTISRLVDPIADVYAIGSTGITTPTLPKTTTPSLLPEQCPKPIPVLPDDKEGLGPFCSLQPLNSRIHDYPQPFFDCRQNYSPGEKIYQCGFGGASACDALGETDACVGVPWICNEDGSWSIGNKDGECTTACSECRPPNAQAPYIDNTQLRLFNFLLEGASPESCINVESPYKLDSGTNVNCTFYQTFTKTLMITTPEKAVAAGWDSCTRVAPPVDPEPTGPCEAGSFYTQCGLGDNFGEDACDPANTGRCVGIPWQCKSDGSGWEITNEFGECTTECANSCIPAKYTCSLTVNVYPTFYVPWLAPIWNNTTYSDFNDQNIGAVFNTQQETGRPGVYTYFKPQAADSTVFPKGKNLPSEDQGGGQEIRQRFFGATDDLKTWTRDFSLKPCALQEFLGLKPAGSCE